MQGEQSGGGPGRGDDVDEIVGAHRRDEASTGHEVMDVLDPEGAAGRAQKRKNYNARHYRSDESHVPQHAVESAEGMSAEDRAGEARRIIARVGGDGAAMDPSEVAPAELKGGIAEIDPDRPWGAQSITPMMDSGPGEPRELILEDRFTDPSDPDGVQRFEPAPLEPKPEKDVELPRTRDGGIYAGIDEENRPKVPRGGVSVEWQPGQASEVSRSGGRHRREETAPEAAQIVDARGGKHAWVGGNHRASAERPAREVVGAPKEPGRWRRTVGGLFRQRPQPGAQPTGAPPEISATETGGVRASVSMDVEPPETVRAAAAQHADAAGDTMRPGRAHVEQQGPEIVVSAPLKLATDDEVHAAELWGRVSQRHVAERDTDTLELLSHGAFPVGRRVAWTGAEAGMPENEWSITQPARHGKATIGIVDAQTGKVMHERVVPVADLIAQQPPYEVDEVVRYREPGGKERKMQVVGSTIDNLVILKEPGEPSPETHDGSRVEDHRYSVDGLTLHEMQSNPEMRAAIEAGPADREEREIFPPTRRIVSRLPNGEMGYQWVALQGDPWQDGSIRIYTREHGGHEAVIGLNELVDGQPKFKPNDPVDVVVGGVIHKRHVKAQGPDGTVTLMADPQRGYQEETAQAAMLLEMQEHPEHFEWQSNESKPKPGVGGRLRESVRRAGAVARRLRRR